MFRAMRIITFFSLLVLCTLSFTLVFGHLVADVNSPPVAGGVSFYKRELYGHSTDSSVLNIRQDGDSEDPDPPDGGEAAAGGSAGSPSPTPTASPSSQPSTATPSAQTPTKTSAPAKTTQTPKETPSSSNSPASTPAPSSFTPTPSSSQTDDDTTGSVVEFFCAILLSIFLKSLVFGFIVLTFAVTKQCSQCFKDCAVKRLSLDTFFDALDSLIAAHEERQRAVNNRLHLPHRFFHNKGAVAGTFASIGVIAAIVLGVAATSWIRRRRRARRQSDEEHAAYFEPKYPIGRTYSDLGQTNSQSREVGSGPLGASATDIAAVPATAEAYPDRAVHYGGYEPRTDVYMPTDYGISYPPGTSYEHHGSAPEPDNGDAYDPYGTYSAPYEAPPPQREYQPSPLSGRATHPFADPANAIGRHPPTANLHPQGGGAPDSMYAPSVDSFYGPSGSGHHPHAHADLPTGINQVLDFEKEIDKNTCRYNRATSQYKNRQVTNIIPRPRRYELPTTRSFKKFTKTSITSTSSSFSSPAAAALLSSTPRAFSISAFSSPAISPVINVEVKLVGVDDAVVEKGADPEGQVHMRGPIVGRMLSAEEGEERQAQAEEPWVPIGSRGRVQTNGSFKVWPVQK
ncbi:hypothetical protein EWM64_g6057 [Hericium alpestre]|uniref:Transmembrane protein n=1 Tax=Hericium alpestre TaxID=135208 RepID=A0A4Y9ZUN8_9AGAM|nr:hypothetical protein EWM64_g6057 [Hericium alpestre]